MFVKRIRIGDKERALLVDAGRFVRVLEPGQYWLMELGHSYTVERFSTRDPQLRTDWATVLVKEHPNVVAHYFTLVETGDTEVAVVWQDGTLLTVVAPGKRVLFWKGMAEIRAIVIDARVEPQAPAALVVPLARLAAESQASFAVVDKSAVGLLFVDNRFVRLLEPGLYAFWAAAGTARVEAVDTRVLPLEVPGQEILTKDKVSIRVNIGAQYKVVDALKAKLGVKDYVEHLYRAVQFAVRQSLGRRTLDEILAEKVNLEPALAEEVRAEMAAIGVQVGPIALKDVILPGEMRDILNQVVTAEKQAQANLIRRREETAATRSLLNTARLMEENPILVRLKELETLEKLTEKVERITVHGGFDSLLPALIAAGDK